MAPPKSDRFIASDDDLDDDLDAGYGTKKSSKKAQGKKKATPTKKTAKRKPKSSDNDEEDEEDDDDDEEDDEDEADQTDEDEDEKPKKKKQKKTSSSSGGMLKNDSGERYVVLGNNKRVTVRKFNKAKLIDIRELISGRKFVAQTYDKDGKTGLPGKKGISLSPELWEKLKASIADVNRCGYRSTIILGHFERRRASSWTSIGQGFRLAPLHRGKPLEQIW
ncbi:BZ3500_MvSof-1268-A1-R1_Chr2-1g04541 [Microbotryum saponariae]|uniref:BZ3500_MvSof-1268-A1-R1_Chr2-1g04541 protein n=1 Tax=Microbotryum saponariae TaxID=289078 RepID=A0A2X0KEU1_9BASI|nr:BZ3500_MvSof-1268-A1-R1_Chr2-1g04541 [Microbotryum saponariae]SCZ91972.1 BZ3501_MvSof-1269-A2-R1_Chr2-1g04197 [Microbotryum saponariae]